MAVIGSLALAVALVTPIYAARLVLAGIMTALRNHAPNAPQAL
ncbi:MAG TPA: hypothetical protein VFA59_19685 [Vicinamibacterales bacterium]|nr:hypothetical protein [Vicinamibacterales bacterium]